MRNRKQDILSGVFFVALIVAFVLVVNSITSGGSRQEARLVEDAVRNAALTCYAVEGAYPEDLDYLREKYQLAYNQDHYIVSYDAFASNLMPAISVVERGKMNP